MMNKWLPEMVESVKKVCSAETRCNSGADPDELLELILQFLTYPKEYATCEECECPVLIESGVCLVCGTEMEEE